VLRHSERKPGGGDDLRKMLQLRPEDKVVVVGDRLFTDVVFGKQNGFFSILVDCIDEESDNFVVKAARKMERLMVQRMGVMKEKV
jgi:phosphatidylglycerophosphatase GEP4